MALRKSQTDPKLGEEINRLLHKLKLDDLRIKQKKEYNRHERIDVLGGHFKDALQLLFIDTTADHYKDTHNNIAKMWVNEIFWGLDYENFPKIKLESEDDDYKTPINTEDIPVQTFDNEYLLPMWGELSVSYVPKGKVISTESLYSLIEFFSRRPQEPRTLLNQLREVLTEILETKDVMLGARLTKRSLSARGIERDSIYFSLHSLGGSYKKYFSTVGIINFKK